MPTVVKSSSTYGKLGDLSTYTVSSSAVPVDPSDSSGSVPTISTTFVDGEDLQYLIGEDFSLSNPSIGKQEGDIISVSAAAGTNRHSVEVHNIMSRLNTEHRLFPMADFATFDSAYLPVFSLEYWTQQCGVFNTKVPGDVLFFQSQWGHYGAWAKDITRPLKSSLTSVSENHQGFLMEGRIMNSLPRNAEAKLTFPAKEGLTDMGTRLPVPVPVDTSGEVLVFGATIGLFGTGRQGDITWRFTDPNGVKKYIRLRADTTNGFYLHRSEDGTIFTQLSNINAPAGVYSIYVGVYRNGSGTVFDMRVHNADGTLLAGSAVTAGDSTMKDTLSMFEVSYKGNDVGSGSQLLYADIFISRMKSLPTTRLPVQKSITTGSKKSTHMVGFSGNVWEHMKQFCSIFHLDVSYQNGQLTIGPRSRDLKVGASFNTLSTSVQNRETARNVEVVNQQHTPTGIVPQVMWAADTVYQVAVGEVQEFVVQTKHSIMELSQPVCVSGIDPYPYKAGAGQYVVTGSDGYIVSPAFWADQGGSVTCDITENEGEIKVRIKGPDFDSVRAPYRISEGDAGRPALYITGTGVKSDPKTLKVPTGNSKAAKDVGTTFDSPFIGTAKYAYDAAARIAKNFASPETTLSFAEPTSYDEVSKLGIAPAGQVIKSKGNIYRVKEATQTHSSVSGSAEQHNTIYQIKRSFTNPPVGEVGTETVSSVGDMNTYYAGKPLGKINLKPLKEVK